MMSNAPIKRGSTAGRVVAAIGIEVARMLANQNPTVACSHPEEGGGLFQRTYELSLRRGIHRLEKTYCRTLDRLLARSAR